MRRLAYVRCDVFTARPLTGNALVVFRDARALTDAEMQAIAREMNLSESAFVLPSDAADARVRIFTPTMELPFAGHPVLGTGFVLAGDDGGRRVVRLETGRGVVTVDVDRERALGWMTQPIPVRREFDALDAACTALGIARSTSPVALYDNGPRYLFLEVGSGGEVAALRPDMTALASFGSLCFVVFARRGDGWKVRVFAPGEGIPEDPGTGAAAGAFAVHLGTLGHIRFGETIVIEQGAEIARPSTLRARATGTAAASSCCHRPREGRGHVRIMMRSILKRSTALTACGRPAGRRRS